ncbi:Wadjet anti-phage system protein JetD domain-containing protein [Guptibacillus hwajinpoensis]|uniref:Wadjet anti-phage system protein JetD domain-containing protein n=1 Tax=Guptibacillus hwajinpoensis TaxID=208199 RepID=UPI00384E52F0
MSIDLNRLVEKELINESKYVNFGQKKRIDSMRFETRIKQMCKDLSVYRASGGYKMFAQGILRAIDLGIIKEMKSVSLNGRNPVLKKEYWLLGIRKKPHLNKDLILKVSDELDLPLSLVNKYDQDGPEWLKIRKIYEFLKSNEPKEYLIREERSLLLFGDVVDNVIEAEKFLSSNKGKQLLDKIGINLSDLKCKIVREEFLWWKDLDIRLVNLRKILIVEGLATYNTIKELLVTSKWPFKYRPDMVIFGSGYKIHSSFEYIEDLFINTRNLDIKYFGDLDPEGFQIYFQLKNRYRSHSIQLAVELYHYLLDRGYQYKTLVLTEQSFIKNSYIRIWEELGLHPQLKLILENLWAEKLRVPQEALNKETIRGWRCNKVVVK